MSEECRDCGRTDGGCDRVRDPSFERATWQDDRVCDHPCLMKHTRYTDTGEVADPGGCYWDRTRDDGNGVEEGVSTLTEIDAGKLVSSEVWTEPDGGTFDPERPTVRSFQGEGVYFFPKDRSLLEEMDTGPKRAYEYADEIAERWAVDEPDPVNPSHYELPGGEQVSWISRYLTSNGGQAVQYIARSTRLDGNNKSSDIADRIEDLKKSVWFIEDEISRLEEEK